MHTTAVTQELQLDERLVPEKDNPSTDGLLIDTPGFSNTVTVLQLKRFYLGWLMLLTEHRAKKAILLDGQSVWKRHGLSVCPPKHVLS